MAETEKLLDLPLEDVIGDRFGIYSKYIIQERALPDVRDGLKPVQRRILYAMSQEGNTHDKAFRKSAKTVGNVIGNYHPHGDTSVYDAMVRLSQSWKVRRPLVEMHGNNGSLDGDPPAAMRYTEARLAAIAAPLMEDIDKQTVPFVPNFDDTIEEPVVLPAKFPNLLVNGSTGISAGYATDIPPHHLGEIIDGAIMEMENPDCTIGDLMTVIKGPDFPTGGILQGVDGIKKAYETGKGRVVVRARTEMEKLRGGREQIVITELPYEVNKAVLVRKMEELRLNKKIEGVAEVRDETDRTGTRVVVELKKEADAAGVLNYFFKTTDLQVTYNFNMVAIHEKTPKLLSLKQILHAYVTHQKEVVTLRSRYELNKAKERAHLVEGLIKAVSILDDVIRVIRASKDKKDAKSNLSSEFGFTEKQAEAIVNLQLYRLTNTDIVTLEKEAEELAAKIAKLEKILGSERELIKVIKKELIHVKKNFSDDRRTIIEAEIEEIKVNLEVMIPSEDVMTGLTKHGYIKRSSLRSYGATKEDQISLKDGDYALYESGIKTTDTLLVFTKKGQYLYIPVHEIPETKWKEMGQHIAHIVPMDEDDEVLSAIAVTDFSEPGYFVFMTKNGQVKRTELAHYKAQRYSKPLMALKLKKGDELIDVHLTDGQSNLLFVTHNGYGLWFDEEEAGVVGQRAAGVKGINLKDDDFVVDGLSFTISDLPYLLFATQRGAVKKMSVFQTLEKSTRARRGSLLLRVLKTKPHRITAAALINSASVVEMLTTKDKLLPLDASSLTASEIKSNGSFIIDEEKDGEIKEFLLKQADESDLE